MTLIGVFYRNVLSGTLRRNQFVFNTFISLVFKPKVSYRAGFIRHNEGFGEKCASSGRRSASSLGLWDKNQKLE